MRVCGTAVRPPSDKPAQFGTIEEATAFAEAELQMPLILAFDGHVLRSASQAG
jgi:hypothetical protein